MSDHQVSVNEPHDAPVYEEHTKHKSSDEREDRIAAISGNLLERSDSLIYAIVGICFFLGALFALGYSFWDFGSAMLNVQGVATKQAVTPQEVVAGTIIKLVSDLLLVLIIMEVMGTVIHYLKSHATSLRPFLFIGIVSATRGILSIGARLSVNQVTGSDFNNAMIELGVNGAVILALGITLKLLGKFVED
ncbi:MAG: hypothetical protein E6I93_12745 [Chloroflexi bacterium]|nr:MAG: hypothetical protein E6I93_12745 [Chloroflexota bacterium]